MIRGVHAMFFTPQADELRAFFRDKLGFPATDAGQGWLLFRLPEVEIGCHPAGDEPGKGSGVHDISFYCDDIRGTVAELRSRGVDFGGEVEDRGWGWVTSVLAPGGLRIQLYEPKYAKQGSDA
jgi:catechol 2,3-dioxygenase-like lactoylglutathione lyase family enzyme